ncbi:MAG: isochorismatase family protein [Rhodobacteraceae bacterium]|nr:isochorismatase family protein [Paracoccaceae bacterium]
MARCLLVIDIQNDYFPGGALPLWQAEETEARLVAAIGAARRSGDRVILVRHVTPAGSGFLAEGSEGAEIRPAIREAAGDAPVVTKRNADAFQDTVLLDHLAGTRELLVAGMMTQNCIIFSAMSEDARPFRVRVIADLCAAPTEMVHRIALTSLGSKLTLTEAGDVWAEEAAGA